MAVLDDLLQKVSDPVLRDRLTKEIHKATKHKKFGLVFEEHLPECTPLYDVPIKKGSRVAVRDTEIKETFTVLSVEDGTVKCVSNNDKELHEFPLNDLVTVAEFGEPIYPYLQTIDTVCNAPDSDLWHTLIEADNYHALQLLEYMYAGKVDCIYIDPPYNKEDSKDWKYNCNYVDKNDMYRHSKWLSMIERRLKLAKKLLNPKDSVLIVTIDELEYLHLGMLLEQMFPEAKMQMVTNVISGKGVSLTGQFSRVEEYIYILMFGDMHVQHQNSSMLDGADDAEDEELEQTDVEVEFIGLRRRNTTNYRTSRPNQFYPFFVDKQDGHIVCVGDAITPDIDRTAVLPPDGCVAIWPLDPEGRERIWGLVPESARKLQDLGCLKIGSWNAAKQTGTVKYWASGNVDKLLNGEIEVTERDKYGTIIHAKYKRPDDLTVRPRKVWHMKSHNASTYGTLLLRKLLVDKRFSFPKSLYAVRDTLRFFISDKPNALIVDFFAGSGTTLHAVNLINADDGGHRRCIMVTNNEIGDKQEDKMRQAGYRPGDPEWEAIGIARYATWPRTVCSIEGHDVNGKPLKGTYLGTDTKMSDGFKANAIYFKLGFLDKNAVALGRQFKELLGVLWMKAGAIGPCPHLAKNATIPDMMILPQNKMAILVDDTAFASFAEQIKQHSEIETVYLVTDSDRGYREMSREIGVKNTYQLYRDYLDNFRINHRR